MASKSAIRHVIAVLAVLVQPSTSARVQAEVSAASGPDFTRDAGTDDGRRLEEAFTRTMEEFQDNESPHVVWSDDAPVITPKEVPQPDSNSVQSCLEAHNLQLLERISAGAYGFVSKAKDANDDLVAVKYMRVRKEQDLAMIRGLASTLKAFAYEVAAQSVADELGVSIPVRDYFVCGKPNRDFTLAFLVMEFIDGQTLESYIKGKEQQSPEDVYCKPNYHGTRAGLTSSGFVPETMYDSLVSSVEQLDNHGLITTDLHTANVMVKSGTDKPIFIDFGLTTKCSHHEGSAVMSIVHRGFGCQVGEQVNQTKPGKSGGKLQCRVERPADDDDLWDDSDDEDFD